MIDKKVKKFYYSAMENMMNEFVNNNESMEDTSTEIILLLIDDQNIVASAVKRMLEGNDDIHFHYCQDPSIALQTAIELSPSVILLDLIMPGINGLTLVKFFRANNNLKDIPIVVMSMKEDGKTKAEAFKTGADDYMVKLPDKIEFVARVRHQSALGQKRKLEKELAEKTIEIQKKNHIIEEKNRQITSSIEYAKNIQQSILPQNKRIEEEFQDSFVIFLPKDIVSGDFYWFNKIENMVFIAALDCTGHGVPGAFMSLIGNSLLNQIVNENKIYSPEKILEKLHNGVRKVLKQESKSSNSRDGMDVAFCVIEKEKNVINFAGARRPLFLIKGKSKELIEIKGDRKSIGGKQKENIRVFEKNKIEYCSGDTIYMFSDGFSDQQNKIEKKFGIKKLRETLKEINIKPLKEQKNILLKELKEHRKEWEQQDDITFLGIKFK